MITQVSIIEKALKVVAKLRPKDRRIEVAIKTQYGHYELIMSYEDWCLFAEALAPQLSEAAVPQLREAVETLKAAIQPEGDPHAE